MRAFVTLMLLVAAVPLQMYLMKYNKQFRELVVEIAQYLPENPLSTVDFSAYLDPNSYLQTVYEYFDWSGSRDNEDDDREPPEDVIRNFRPQHLAYRIGDIVLTQRMAVGVVTGWQIDLKNLKKEPKYFILAETFEEEIEEKQNKLIGLEAIQVNHKKIDYYFENFDGLRYEPKKWLKKLYPKD